MNSIEISARLLADNESLSESPDCFQRDEMLRFKVIE
jgi:hypothetical protein